jgi:hypothetical protein
MHLYLRSWRWKLKAGISLARIIQFQVQLTE